MTQKTRQVRRIQTFTKTWRHILTIHIQITIITKQFPNGKPLEMQKGTMGPSQTGYLNTNWNGTQIYLTLIIFKDSWTLPRKIVRTCIIDMIPFVKLSSRKKWQLILKNWGVNLRILDQRTSPSTHHTMMSTQTFAASLWDQEEKVQSA